MKNYNNNFIESIGNTPLIKLKAASEKTGCNIYGKAEYLNPGGSVKDRAALALIKDAEEKKLISKGGIIVEGTAGNTGIGLCLIGNSIGYKTITVLYPLALPTKHKPMPVFPAVPSTIVPPFEINFFSSASLIKAQAALSLIDPPGFKYSAFP